MIDASTEPIVRAAYRVQQTALRLPLIGLQQALRFAASPEKAPPDEALSFGRAAGLTRLEPVVRERLDLESDRP